MASVCGDYRRLRRQQLYSLINALKRENDCLKTDLIKYKLLSNKCQKYLQFLTEISETNDTNSENDFIQQINALNDIKNSFVLIESDIKVNELSNSKSFVIQIKITLN